jgi:hypothetical protein
MTSQTLTLAAQKAAERILSNLEDHPQFKAVCLRLGDIGEAELVGMFRDAILAEVKEASPVRYVCDCEAVYSSIRQLEACQANNHGLRRQS